MGDFGDFGDFGPSPLLAVWRKWRDDAARCLCLSLGLPADVVYGALDRAIDRATVPEPDLVVNAPPPREIERPPVRS